MLNKSLTSCNKKLKFDYANLSLKYQELDLAFDALDEEQQKLKRKSSKSIYLLLVMILWSCLTLLLVIILLLLVQKLTMIGRNNLRRNLKA